MIDDIAEKDKRDNMKRTTEDMTKTYLASVLRVKSWCCGVEGKTGRGFDMQAPFIAHSSKLRSLASTVVPTEHDCTPFTACSAIVIPSGKGE